MHFIILVEMIIKGEFGENEYQEINKIFTIDNWDFNHLPIRSSAC